MPLKWVCCLGAGAAVAGPGAQLLPAKPPVAGTGEPALAAAEGNTEDWKPPRPAINSPEGMS